MRRSRSNRSGRPVRPMDWECAQASVGQATTGGTVVASQYLVQPSFLRQYYTDPTLMVTRAFVSGRSDGTAVGAFYAAVGIIAWNDINDLPPGDPPGPITNCNADWIARWVQCVPDGTPASQFSMNIFDNTHLVKSKRRLGNDKGILVCFQTFSPTGYANILVTYAADFRFLIKE